MISFDDLSQSQDVQPVDLSPIINSINSINSSISFNEFHEHDLMGLCTKLKNGLYLDSIKIGESFTPGFQIPINRVDAYYINSDIPIMDSATFGFFYNKPFLKSSSLMPSLQWACFYKSGSGNFSDKTEWLTYLMGSNYTLASDNGMLKRLDLVYRPDTQIYTYPLTGFTGALETLNIHIQNAVGTFTKYLELKRSAFNYCNIKEFHIGWANDTKPISYIYRAGCIRYCSNLESLNLNGSIELDAFFYVHCNNFYIDHSNISHGLGRSQRFSFTNTFRLYHFCQYNSETISNNNSSITDFFKDNTSLMSVVNIVYENY